MRRILFIVVFFMIFAFSEKAKCFLPPLDIDVVWIYFDYETGYTNDALTIVKNASTPIATPEWYPAYSRNNRFAYIKGQTNRKIKVRFWHNQGAGAITSIHVMTTGTGYYPGTIAESIVYFSSGSSYGDAILTMTNGMVSNYVQFWGFYYSWLVTKVNGEPLNPYLNIGMTGGHDYYILLGPPQAPMSVPWTDVLDDACVWARNESTIPGAVNKIVITLYSCGFNYNIDGRGAPRYDGFSQFNLTKFLSELGTAVPVNCLDMGKAVTTFGNAIGCGLALTTYGETGSGENSIDGPLNCIDPIGTPGSTNNPFGTPLIADDCRITGFRYHAFSEWTSNNNVWDATLKYDIDSDPDNVTGSNPGCGTTTSGHTWLLPSNEAEPTYFSRLIDPWPKWYSHTPTLRRNRSFAIY